MALDKTMRNNELLTALGFFGTPVKRNRTRASGEGTISKRKNTWFGRVTLGFDQNGKQIRKGVSAPTRKECVAKMQALKVEYEEKNLPIISSHTPTLIEWLETWLAQYKPNMSQGTKQKYNILLNKIRASELKDKKLNKILPIEIQQFVNTLTSHDIATRMVGFLRDSMRSAVENGIIPRSIAETLRNNVEQNEPRFEETEKAFTETEEQRFIEAIQDNPYRILYFLCLYAGLRRGEACALSWSSVDMEKRLLSIKESATRSEASGYKIGKTKTARSVRRVPISNNLYDELISIERTGDLVFSNNGKMLNPDILTMDFKKVMTQLGYHHTLHQLRHTFATRCHSKGIDIKVVQAWMGHVKAEMTLDTYTHATADDLLAGAEKLNS